jgi:hypothetical protein
MTSYSDILFAATTANRLLRTDWHFIWQATGWTDIMHANFRQPRTPYSIAASRQALEENPCEHKSSSRPVPVRRTRGTTR